MKTKVLRQIIDEGPITSKQLTINCGINLSEDRTTRIIGLIVEELVKEGWPIAGSQQGFFIAKTLRDKRIYRNRLMKHINGTKRRLKSFEEAYKKFKSDEQHYMNIITLSNKRKIKRRKKS